MVESLLGLARGRTVVKAADDFEAPRTVMYFDVPEGRSPESIAAKLSQILLGEVKGFYRVLQEQNAFHESIGVFEALRKVAGNPRVVVSRHQGGGGAENLFDAARAANPSVAAATAVTVKRRKEGDFKEESADRKDRFQKNGACVKLQPDAPADCPVCGAELVDTPEGKSCPNASAPRVELCPLCGEELQYDEQGNSRCPSVGG
ncbi:hypothetical protein [Polyangium spumosum]|uniref:Uncharacterized protein n=1 Tax=Polyangium spumosum TaxID=889282 RepID=A0A6N7Q1U8_9BACT|nr:hypothetical protein [Polyangium spumosum]MRG94931.1 hypothetical protein [Polyangium spumosum]